MKVMAHSLRFKLLFVLSSGEFSVQDLV